MNDYAKIGKVAVAIAAFLGVLAGGLDFKWGQSASAVKLDSIILRMDSLSAQALETKVMVKAIGDRQQAIDERVQTLEEDKGDAERREELRLAVQKELWAESARKYRAAQDAAGSE